MSTQLLVVAVIFLAVFTQSLSGFGVALVAMSLLPALIPIQVAAPLVAVVGLTIEFFLLLRYRSALNLLVVWRLIAASAFGIPLGVWALGRLDGEVVLAVLGILISGYAIYALLNLRMPELTHSGWVYFSGFIAGVLGGAYTTSGPPVIVYGDCRRWERAEFKSNLQGFFFVSSIFIVIAHAFGQNLTPIIWRYYLLCIPGMIIGIIAGISLDKVIDPVLYRKIVLGLLVVLGLRLIF
ncbi:MAG: sulfite exporter TauE/SafE family protein [Anaerolineales bacterium]|nr:sulfite exporter TauE/SafE family protein [Anaerolineales bacterium]